MPLVRLNTPVRVPVPGGKLIEEHCGRVSDRRDDYSVAHMVAPAGWSEPAQTPAFDEVTIVVRGELAVESGGSETVVRAGESVLVGRGTTVRYVNRSSEPCEYWAICVPAFTVERAGR